MFFAVQSRLLWSHTRGVQALSLWALWAEKARYNYPENGRHFWLDICPCYPSNRGTALLDTLYVYFRSYSLVCLLTNT